MIPRPFYYTMRKTGAVYFFPQKKVNCPRFSQSLNRSLREDTDMKKDIWTRMIRRYAIASVAGLIACIILFWQLEIIPAGQATPRWELFATVFAGLLLFGGLFGIAVSFFFRMWSKEQS